MTDSLKRKLMTADEAVKLIPDGGTIRVSGAALVCSAAMIFKNIGESYVKTGHPRDLCIVSEGSPGSNVEGYNFFGHVAHKGLVRRVVGGHMGFHHALFPLIRSNEIEGYNISQGVLSILTNERAAGKKGYLTKVGLGTQQDPRHEGCKLNVGLEMEDLVELRVDDGEEYLWFKAIREDVTVLKASYADLNGNITLMAEPSNNDALASAMAVRNEGGKVIVYVKELKNEYFNPRLVHIPHFLVDAIIVDTSLVQAAPHLAYSPYFSNEERCGEEEIHAIIDNDAKNGSQKRRIEHKIIARRAAMELSPEAVVNIGFGIPQMISGEVIGLGINTSSVVLTTETGVSGGVQHPSVFSVSMNSDAIYDQASQFRFYEGGGLDIGFLGALEVDRRGNVNVCKKGKRLAGVGGFNYIVHSSSKLVYCFNFMRGSGYHIKDGTLVPYDGKDKKIIEEVESISMNAGIEFANGKTVLYITERCVFRLIDGGLEIVEVAPGLDLKKDILDHLDFTPSIAEDIREMPKICFKTKGMDHAG